MLGLNYYRTAIDIFNCVNYGNITGGELAGGMCGRGGIGDKGRAINCVNYGRAYTTSTSGSSHGISSGGGIFADCANYGEVGGYEIGNATSILNCTVKSVGGKPLCSSTQFVKNCSLDYSDANGDPSYIVGNCSGSVENLYVVQNGRSTTTRLKILNSQTTDVTLKNILVDATYSTDTIQSGSLLYGSLTSGKTIKSEGVVISQTSVNTWRKEYYGTDFSGFFYTWKEGRIGLKAVEGAGLYRGQVSERYLYRNIFNAMDHTYEPTEEDREYRGNNMARSKGWVDLGEYYQINYLESTGTQWIDTGYCPNQDTELQLDWKVEGIFNAKTNNTVIFNAKNNQQIGNGHPVFQVNFGGTAVEANTMYYWVSDKTYSEGATIYRHIINDGVIRNRNTLVVKSGSFSYGGVQGQIGTLTQSLDRSLTLLYEPGQTAFSCYNAIIYGLKIYENETLVHDFVPAMRRSDNKLGLYDKVEGKFCTNQGAGEFWGA